MDTVNSGDKSDKGVFEGRDKATGQFLQGNIGRKKGTKSGRKVALAMLDKVWKKAGSIKAFEKALTEYAEQNPLECFLKFVMPLLPKETKIEGVEAQTVNYLITYYGKQGKKVNDTPHISSDKVQG